MPANPLNAKFFKLTTDYPLDKVIYLASGSFNMTATLNGLLSFAHNLPFTPLISGSWSLTSDFSVQYDFNTGTTPTQNSGFSPFDKSINDPYADATNINLQYTNTSSATTAYYRVYGFMPPGVDFNIPGTASSGDNFVLNLDYNYTKLYMYDTVPVGSTPFSQNIVHGLGYYPQIMAWYRDTSNNIYPVSSSLVSGSTPTTGGNIFLPDTNSFTLYVPSGAAVNAMYYRVYLDDR